VAEKRPPDVGDADVNPVAANLRVGLLENGALVAHKGTTE
jgi:hypothetical protein